MLKTWMFSGCKISILYEFAFKKAALYRSGNTDNQTVNKEWLVDDDVMVGKMHWIIWPSYMEPDSGYQA